MIALAPIEVEILLCNEMEQKITSSVRYRSGETNSGISS